MLSSRNKFYDLEDGKRFRWVGAIVMLPILWACLIAMLVLEAKRDAKFWWIAIVTGILTVSSTIWWFVVGRRPRNLHPGVALDPATHGKLWDAIEELALRRGETPWEWAFVANETTLVTTTSAISLPYFALFLDRAKFLLAFGANVGTADYAEVRELYAQIAVALDAFYDRVAHGFFTGQPVNFYSAFIESPEYDGLGISDTCLAVETMTPEAREVLELALSADLLTSTRAAAEAARRGAH